MWELVTSREPRQGSIFVSDLEEAMEHIHNHLQVTPNWGAEVNATKSRATVRRGLDRLGADRSLVKIPEDQCPITHLGRQKLSQQHRRGTGCLGSRAVDEDQEPWQTELNAGQPSALAAEAANSLPGCINRSPARRLRKMIIPLYAALVKSLSTYCIQVWASQIQERHA